MRQTAITILNGTISNDTLTGTADADILYGLDGNDSITAGAGTNRIDAGDGNDTIFIDGTATNGASRVPANGIDADHDQSTFVTTPVAGTHGALTINSTGAWSYALNNSLTAVQSHNFGQSLTDTITVNSLDGSQPRSQSSSTARMNRSSASSALLATTISTASQATTN